MHIDEVIGIKPVENCVMPSTWESWVFACMHAWSASQLIIITIHAWCLQLCTLCTVRRSEYMLYGGKDINSVYMHVNSLVMSLDRFLPIRLNACERACENRACGHMKFDYTFSNFHDSYFFMLISYRHDIFNTH